MKKIKPLYLILLLVLAIWYFMKKGIVRKEKLTKNFKRSEFDSGDGVLMSDDVYSNIEEVAKNLQVLRDYLNAPITVNSGYRSEAHNKKVGGVSNSQHVLGKAADINVKGYTQSVVASTIEHLIAGGKMKQGGIGIYPHFIHYDIRGSKARWDFR